MKFCNEGKILEEHMKKEIEEFELGKRHLANMMGVDANSMTQADIDVNLEYVAVYNLSCILKF